MTITLRKLRVAKNEMVSYKVANTRVHGTVYLDKKMFSGIAPETLTLSGDNLADIPVAPPVVAQTAAGTPSVQTAGPLDAPVI